MPLPAPGRLAHRGARSLAACACALLGAALSASPGAAQEWSFVGARYQGMGGAGVAVVDDVHAPYWNPGALAFPGRQGVAVPIGAQVAAEGSILRDVDDVASFIDSLSSGELDQLLTDLEAGNPIDAAQRATALELLVSRLPALDEEGEGLVAGVHASLLVRVGRIGVTGLGLAHFGADPVFDRENLSLSSLSGGAAIDELVDPGTAMDRYGPGAAPSVVGQLEALFTTAMSGNPNLQAEELVFQAEQAGLDVNSPGVAQGLLDVATATASATAGGFDENLSGAFVRGLAVEEIGVAYGHPLPLPVRRLDGKIGIGGHLKYLYGTTFNKFIRYDDVDSGSDLANELGDTDNREVSHTVSLDVGVLARPWEWLRFGLTARNVTSPEFDLARDPTDPAGPSKLTLEPQVRAGVALWLLPGWVIAFDADLTENETDLLDGYASRLVSLGTEFGLGLGPVELALRGGAYLNTASEDLDGVALTGGLGLRVFGFALDVAAGASPRTQEIEAANDQELPSRVNASVMLSYQVAF